MTTAGLIVFTAQWRRLAGGQWSPYSTATVTVSCSYPACYNPTLAASCFEHTYLSAQLLIQL